MPLSAVVLQVREGALQALLWQRGTRAVRWARGRCPAAGSPPTRRWRSRSCGTWRRRSTCARSRTSSSSQPTATRSATSTSWEVATAYLGLVPLGVDPGIPADTRWHDVDALPQIAFDHGAIVLAGARAPARRSSPTRTPGSRSRRRRSRWASCERSTSPALGHEVSATNLKRVLLRRGVIAGDRRTQERRVGQAGGPADVFRFSLARPRDHRPVRGTAPAGRPLTKRPNRPIYLVCGRFPHGSRSSRSSASSPRQALRRPCSGIRADAPVAAAPATRYPRATADERRSDA